MDKNAIFCRASSDRFLIFALPKTGIRALEKWRQENNLSRSNSIDYDTETRDMYCIWRPPYERIVTGLFTAFSATSAADIPDPLVGEGDLERRRLSFIKHFNKFTETNDFDYNEFVQNHTLIRTRPLDPFKNMIWIHLDQLSLLHNHLNNKYNQNYTEIEQFNTKEYTADWGKTSPEECKYMLKKNPNTTLAIAKRATIDFHPLEILNLIKTS